MLPITLLAALSLLAQPATPAQPQPTPTPAPVPAAPAQPTPPQPDRVAEATAPFTIRPGYQVSVAVLDCPGARFLEFDDRRGPDATLFVARTQYGDILAFQDKNNDGVYETQTTFLSGKPMVHGLYFYEGWLWFTTTGSVHRARDTNNDGVADDIIDVVKPGSMPAGGTHMWRPILVDEEGFYTAIGDGSNISDQLDSERQKIWRYSLDGTTKHIFSSGIRNTEKLRFRPGTFDVWGIDHGSDYFGAEYGESPDRQPITDANPPDEINLYRDGQFYGHPILVGNVIPRPEYAKRDDLLALAATTVKPEWCLPAHWAVNGFTFIDPAINQVAGAAQGAGFPEDHEGDMFIAAHGSWNASKRTGYCVARVLFDPMNARPYGLLPIVSCIEDPAGHAIVRARPVDCAQSRDGSILFSSDQPGRIFRIRYKK